MKTSLWLGAAMALAGAVPAAGYDDIRFLEPIKLQGLAKPGAAAVTATRIYVVDEKKSQLQILDRDGKFVKLVGKRGASRGELSGPKAVAAAMDGTVFVADTGNSRIQVFDADGKLLDAFGVKGSEPGRLSYPEGVAVGGFGRVYVSDTGNHRVQVYTRDGIFLFGFGEKGSGPGQLKGPTRLFVDPGDFVYVLDDGNGRIAKFDASARMVKEFPLEGADFALDPYGFLYVLDPKPGKVREIAPDGYVPGAFGSKGSGPGQLKSPSAIAIGPDGVIFVIDAGNGRLQRAELSSRSKTARPAASTASGLLVSGPVAAVPLKAIALAAKGARAYAYLPEPGQFAALDKDGRELFRFGRRSGKDASVTEGCEGIAASDAHGIFVSDTKGDKLQHFDSSGTFIANLASSTGFFDSKKKEGRVRSPRGLAVSEKGAVYVADTDNRRVDAFTPQGAFVFGFGPQVGPYELKEPVAVAWDPAGFVYVLDRKLKKVFKCEPSGGFMLAWGEEGSGPGQLDDPVALAFDGRGYVYVLDQGAKRVAVFHRDDGHWVTNFFAEGDDDRSLKAPAALAVLGERLLVADPGRAKLLAFTLHPLAAPPAAVSTAAVEGVVELGWRPSADPWVARYRVERSSSAAGPWEEAGAVEKPPFKDARVSVYNGYWYRLAAEARTGDLGPASEPVYVFVPGAFNRAPVELASVEIGNMLPANYKWYLKNAVGKAVVANNVNVPFQNVKVGFRLKDFMDFATETVIGKLGAMEKVDVGLMATVNNKILEVTEETPIQAEVSVTYFESGKPHTVSIAKPLRVYSRNAMIWDDPERINAFITSNDTPVLEFGKKVLLEAAPAPSAGALNRPLVDALRLWHAVGEAGVRFQASPTNPFEAVSKDPSFPVDYTQFPRETLKRKSGECDDLVTLFASLFAAANVRPVLLDYPGHIAMMIDSGEADAQAVGLPESQLVRYEDRWWMPLEPTLVGSPFAESHRHALAAFRDMEKSQRARIVDPRKAVASYEPVTMPASEWTAPVPEAGAVARRLEADAKEFAQARYAFLKGKLEASLAAAPKDADAINRLGLLEIDMGRSKAAAERFAKALEADPEDAAAANNLGSVAFLEGDHALALERFRKAAELDPADAGIWLNLAKTAAKLKDGEKVKEFGHKALAAAAEADRPRFEAALGALSKGEVR